METIPKIDCEKIGFFRKTHGVHGELVLEFETQYETSIENSNRFFVELEGLLVPFYVFTDGFRFKSDNSAIVRFEGVESEKYAKRMAGSSVFIFKKEIQSVPDEFVGSGLLNFILYDEVLGKIGKIEQVDNYSGNIVMTVNFRSKELLVPFNEDFLLSIDKNNKTVTLKIPDGLIE